jgi:elongation factor Ts
VADISAKDVQRLRQETGAGMMDCKRALQEADGDIEKAKEVLRLKGLAKSQKLSERSADEGVVEAYLHTPDPGMPPKVGVLVELNCSTDFVAKTDGFRKLARDIALHIAAMPTVRYASEEDIPEADREAELRVFEQQAADKPEQVRAKIAEGKLRKWMEDVVLLNQPHVNTDKYEGKTIEQLRAELSGQTGENVVIRRFAKFQVGA